MRTKELPEGFSFEGWVPTAEGWSAKVSLGGRSLPMTIPYKDAAELGERVDSLIDVQVESAVLALLDWAAAHPSEKSVAMLGSEFPVCPLCGRRS